MNRFVYLDNNATTMIFTESYEEMKPFLGLQYGNPSSLYSFGVNVKEAIIKARENTAKLINTNAENIVFTSGGSEGNCSAINSGINSFPDKRKIITTVVEHSSILEYCNLLAKRGYDIIYIPVDKDGNLKLKELENQIDEKTAVVSIQYANNETGVIFDIDQINKIINKKKKKFDFLFCMDLVQAIGKIGVNIEDFAVDVAVFSGHKFHAPKGTGFMYVKNKETFIPLISGHQESNLRGGTENVCGIVGLGVAAQLLLQKKDNIKKIEELRLYLEKELVKAFPKCIINGSETKRLCNTVSLSIPNKNGNELMFALEREGICVSTGSACNSESSEPSYVLTSMKVPFPSNTIRISLSDLTTKSEVDYFLNTLNKLLK